LQKRKFPQIHPRQDVKRFQDNWPPRTTSAPTYAAALGPPPNPPLNTGSYPPQSTTSPQPQQPQSDLRELKEAMKGIMDQMGIILQLLTTLLAKLA
jgi:hypothetical protein